MSRVGRRPIPIPSGVTVTIDGGHVAVKGPKGELSCDIEPRLIVQQEDGTLTVDRPNNEAYMRQQHGLARTLIANMVTGVTEGFVKKLTLVGVGYRANLEGNTLTLSLGFSHPVVIEPRPGVSFSLEQADRQRQQVISVSGIDKQQVGQQAADIRRIRPPDSYKGKGVRYLGEEVKTKPGKRGATGK
ncbi:MAG: 50S ribosomal protein L6 [Fimbriimonadales bacterium]